MAQPDFEILLNGQPIVAMLRLIDFQGVEGANRGTLGVNQETPAKPGSSAQSCTLVGELSEATRLFYSPGRRNASTFSERGLSQGCQERMALFCDSNFPNPYHHICLCRCLVVGPW